MRPVAGEGNAVAGAERVAVLAVDDDFERAFQHMDEFLALVMIGAIAGCARLEYPFLAIQQRQVFGKPEDMLAVDVPF